MRTVEILCFVRAFAVLVLIGMMFQGWRRRKHKCVSREEFIQQFANAGIPRKIPDAVYKFRFSIKSQRFRFPEQDSPCSGASTLQYCC